MNPSLLPVSATETRNSASATIDSLSPLQIVRLMNAEDQHVIDAVAQKNWRLPRDRGDCRTVLQRRSADLC
ncbi:MAG: hypothetical protein WKF77_02745 [Planctomycetaceae bacterium]